MIKAGIIGATGYAGNEIVRLLLGHKDVEVAWYGSRSYIDQKYADVYQNFFKLVDAKCMDDNMEALADEVDVIFTATPQGLCAGKEVLINFTPHLIPMNRGILVTAYASLTKDVSYEEVKAIYDKYYENETFVRVLDKDVCPQTKCVEGSNYVDVNFKIDPRTHRVIMMGAMDNLVKGAAGQAVQNMNLMFGFKEDEGLLQVPMCP